MDCSLGPVSQVVFSESFFQLTSPWTAVWITCLTHLRALLPRPLYPFFLVYTDFNLRLRLLFCKSKYLIKSWTDLLRWLKVKVALSCPTLCDLMDIQSMEFSRPEHWSGQPFPSPRDLPKPGIKPRSPAWQADSLPAEPPGKPKNTEVGSLFLLQGIYLTQESNRGLLHCRRILHQLSYKGSP